MDGNRTRQTEVLGLVGFEDRGAHQDAYTSPERTALANQTVHVAACATIFPESAEPSDCSAQPR